MSKEDPLGDRMKAYENAYAGHRFLPLIPICVRLDGRSFHTYTKDLDRPFDVGFCKTMMETTKYLVEETGATIGYTQSDEISLVFYSDNHKSQVFFDGREHKMVSVLASMCTLAFYKQSLIHMPNKRDLNPSFDCRAWIVPNGTEAANTLLWREKDATKNSITAAAFSVYSASDLHGKNSREKMDMLFAKQINWNNYPAYFKRGTYFQKKSVKRKFTAEELLNLPEMHNARRNPDMEFDRSYVVHLNIPPLSMITNRSDVVLLGADPVVESQHFMSL